MSAPQIKGWCPGVHHPMASNDGLVLRVRPFFNELSPQQALGLCDIAHEFGNGVLDLTSRANLQIRGVQATQHGAVITRLAQLDVIDADPRLEGRRNILLPVTWAQGDLTHRLACAVHAGLSTMPDLPQKTGFAIDTGSYGCLSDASADFRFELGGDGGLILRADGAMGGRAIDESGAIGAVMELADWFVHSGGITHGRMRRHLAHHTLPADWCRAEPRAQAGLPQMGVHGQDTILGAPFGKIQAYDLRAALRTSMPDAIRLMPGRCLALKGAMLRAAPGFATAPSALMRSHACPGAPYCPQASVQTLDLARAAIHKTQKPMHVSGCAKGCAHPAAFDVTLVGQSGKFDLVLGAAPWEKPARRGLDPCEIFDLCELS